MNDDAEDMAVLTHLTAAPRPQPGGMTRPPGAAAARRVSARRHIARVAGAALLVAGVVAGVPIGIATQKDAAPSFVATREPTEQEPTRQPGPAVDSPTPTVVGTTRSTPAPTSSGAPANERAAPPSVEPSEPVDPVLVVVATEAGPSRAGELLDLVGPPYLTPESDQGGNGTWLLSPCGSPVHQLDARRLGWFSMRTIPGDGGTFYDAATYRTVEEAESVLRSFTQDTATCWAPPGDSSASSIWQPLVEESTVFAGVEREYREPDAAEIEGGFVNRWATVYAAARDGRVVSLVTYASPYVGADVAASQGDSRAGSGTYQGSSSWARTMTPRAVDEATSLAADAAALIGD